MSEDMGTANRCKPRQRRPMTPRSIRPSSATALAQRRSEFGTRYYDPAVGRWTQLDPSGIDQHYVYTGNDPVNRIDPTGRWFEWGGTNGPCSWSEESSSRFDYTDECAAHDLCYDRAGSEIAKAVCDDRFGAALHAEDDGLLDWVRAETYSFFVDTFSNPF